MTFSSSLEKLNGCDTVQIGQMGRWSELDDLLSCLGNGMVIYALPLLMGRRLKPSIELEASFMR